MMEDQGPRVADYFVVAGLTEGSRPLEEEISSEGNRKPSSKVMGPITDVAVIVRSQQEKVPEGFTCLETTPQGFPADLNHGCLGSPSIFLCVKRGFDKPPLTDLGILYEGKERVMHGCEIVSTTPCGYPANVNNRIGVGSQRAYISFRRAPDSAPHNSLAVVDICVILMNKGETPPHAFCLINKNLNKGSMVGSDVFLCYKKSAVRGNSLAYQAGTLSRYPLGDHDDFAYPESVPRFCMPMGASVETWLPDRTHPLPVFSTFVLTDSSGDKVYGAAVSFYESYPEDKLTPQQKKDLNVDKKGGSPKKTPAYSVHTNKCVCLLSHWPFFDAFKKFLSFIYRISVSGPHTIPLERHISHFMHEVPFPTPQRPRILMELGHESVVLAQPQTSPIPLNGASYCAMLRYLGPENSLNLLTFVLLEHKILLHSLRMALLTGVAEAVSSMIFPLYWQCPYIPLCPLSLSDVLSAPLPVITGVDSRYFDMYDPPGDATCVDIDTNTILQSEEKKPVTWKILPKKPAKRLHSTLCKLYVELCQSALGDGVSDDLAVEIAPLDNDFTRKKKQVAMEFRIQEAFLTFMASMLKGYQAHLLPITQQPNHRVTDASARFDSPGFIKTRDKTSHPFFKLYLKTQMFVTFIEDRSFVTENDDRFAFFDECTEKIDLDSKEEVKLIDFESDRGSEHTVFIMPPDPTGMVEEAYTYTVFPRLRAELFQPPRVSLINTPGGRSLRSGITNSPLARRSKHEIKVSQKLAKKTAESPERWADFLLSQCFALWFLHLPSYVKATHSKTRALRTAFEVLKKMQAKELQTTDEACYRVLMQLCGQYSQPVLAVQTFMEMKHCGMVPNAITYGYYNKAVMESTWPTTSFSGYQQWVKLRNTLLAVALFKKGINRRSYSDTSSNEVDIGSRSSGDSGSSDPLNDIPAANNLKLLLEHPNGLTRSEKCSTGNSDMGYSSMIMDESAPNELASPELSPIRSSRKEGEDSPDTNAESNKLLFDLDEIDENGDSKESNDTLINTGSAVSTPVNITAPSRPTNDLLGSIVRTSVSSAEGSPCVTSNGHHEGNHEESVFENLSPPSDAARRRHRSAGDHNWTIHQSLRKRKTSSGSGSASPVAMLLESDPEMAKDIFGSDVKILQSLTHIPVSRTSPNNLHCTNKQHEELIQQDSTSHQRSRSLGSKPGFWEQKSTGLDGSGDEVRNTKELVSICDQIKSLSTDVKNQDVQSTQQVKPINGDLLISFDMDHPGQEDGEDTPMNSLEDSESITRTETLEDIKSSDSRTCDPSSDTIPTVNTPTANGDINEDLFKMPATPVKKCNGDVEHEAVNGSTSDTDDKSAHGESASNEELDKDAADVSSPIFQKGQSKQSQDSKSQVVSKIPKTPQRNSFLANFASPFSPRFSKPAINKTLSLASSQMEMAGASFRAKATDLASKFGEYTRTFSNPGTPRSAINSKSVTGSLIDLDSNDSLPDQTPEMASSWNDRFLDTATWDDLGILMPLSLAGSSQSLNQPIGVDQEDFSFRRQCALEVNMTSCYHCDSCESTLYDEAIMAGWSADDSNLNTSCCFCNSQLVPFLSVDIRDLRDTSAIHAITTSPSSESMHSINSAPGPLLKRMDSSPLPITADLNSTGQSVSSMDNLSVASDSDLLSGPPPLLVPEGAVKLSHTSDNKNTGVSPTTHRRRSTSECVTTDLAQKSLSVMDKPSVPVNGLRSMTLPRIRAIDEGSHCSSLPSSVQGSREYLPPPRCREPQPVPSVPYLSPLVLRKEVENVIENEGEVCLRSQEFVTQHPIIFWNLVWYFRRLDIPNYLPGVLLAAYSENRDGSESGTFLPKDSRYVKINVLWDNMKLYEGMGLPMYILWSSQGSGLQQTLMSEHQAFSKQFMLSIVKCIRYNNVLTPITMLLEEFKKRYGDTQKKRHSIYRELVYLTFMSLGRENIDHDAFDKEYRQAYNKLSDDMKNQLRAEDKPPNRSTQMCRKVFNDLYLSYFK